MLEVPSYYGLIALGIVVMIASSEALIVFGIWLKNRKDEKRAKKLKNGSQNVNFDR